VRAALLGRRALWSGAPDQGTTNRAAKDALLGNLARWSAGNYATTRGPGLLALQDLSADPAARYGWLRAILGANVTADVTLRSYSSVRSLTAAGLEVLTSNGSVIAYPNMASYGFQLPSGAPNVSLAAVGQTGTTVGGQVVLATMEGANTGGASVMSDKDDYAPGQVATFTGSGFQAGEAVTITLHEDPTVHQDRTLSATADASGNFVHASWAPEPHDLGVRFILTAVGQSSGRRAQTTFTDGASITTISPSVGPLEGDIEVTISGGGFGGSGATVTFGGATARIVSQTGGLLKVTAPARQTAGAVDVVVTVRDGNAFSSATAVNGFTYRSAKAAGSVSISILPSGASFGGAFTPSFTKLGDGATSVTSKSSSVCTVNSDGTVSFAAVGTCTLQAAVTEGTSHLAATGAEQSFAVGKATATVAVSCGVGPYTYTGAAQTPCTATATGAGGLNETLTVGYTNNANAGTATASASYAATANYTAASDSKTFAIGKAPSTTTVTCPTGPFTYTGQAQTPCAATVTGAGGLNLSPAPSYADNVNAGTATASVTYAGGDNHLGSTASKTFAIGAATATVAVSCGVGPYTYTGAAQTPCTATATGAGGLNQTLTPTYTDNVNAGTATASASLAGTANYTGGTGSATFAIGKAASTVTVSCTGAPFTYTGQAQTPCSAAVTGAGGLNLTPTPTYTNNTNAGTATASFSYTGGDNHLGSSDSKTFAIGKAASTVTVTCTGAPFTYSGAAQTPCSAMVAGAGLTGQTAVVSYTDNTNAGTATASASYAGGANHQGSTGSATFAIGRKAASVTPAAAGKTYGEQDPTLMGSVSGFLAGDNVSATYNRAAGETVAGSPYTITAMPVAAAGVLGNYEITVSTAAFTIAKAPSTTAVVCTGAPFTYTGQAQTPCTAAVTGAGGLNLTPTPTYTNNTNAGTATASFSYTGGANHLGSSDSKTFAIGKAPSTTVVSCAAGPFTYTGQAQTPCTVAVTGAGGLELSPTPSYADNVNAGTASASFSYAGGDNHLGSTASKTFSIAKAASATMVAVPASATYTGQPQGATAEATGLSGTVLGAPAVSYEKKNAGGAYEAFSGVPTDAGDYRASASFVATGNYETSQDSKTYTIAKATATVAVSCGVGPFTYTGSAQTPCTATATGAGGLNQTLTPTYTDNINAGTATASASYAATPNYTAGSDSKTFTIVKALTTTTVSCTAGPFTYTGAPQTPCSATVAGIGGLSHSISVAYTNNVNAGTATATASFTGAANHEPSTDSKTFSIAQAPATITLSNLVQPIGSTLGVTAATSPANVLTRITYKVANEWTITPPSTAAGVYPVRVESANPNYIGAVEGFYVIYDPNGGFVTGGGWVQSQQSYCMGGNALCANATGKANFGFVSKYQRGANVPTGNTEFRLQAGGFDLKSTAYEFLVVNQGGGNAQFKGTATINGSGSYKFMIWATDGAPDGFRIRIWTENAGVQTDVYDTGTELTLTGTGGSGSIQIHQANR
jgi:hypothetical protein